MAGLSRDFLWREVSGMAGYVSLAALVALTPTPSFGQPAPTKAQRCTRTPGTTGPCPDGNCKCPAQQFYCPEVDPGSWTSS